MPQKPNLLFLCGQNKRRSRTAEYLFKNDPRFHIRSAGLSPKSDRKISEKDLLWADLVLVMEHKHSKKIRTLYPHLELPSIKVLSIPDEYEYETVDALLFLRRSCPDQGVRVCVTAKFQVPHLQPVNCGLS